MHPAWSPAETESLHNLADEEARQLLENSPLAGPQNIPKSKGVKKIALDNRNWFRKILVPNREAPGRAKRGVFQIVAQLMSPYAQRDYLASIGGTKRAYNDVRLAWESSKDDWGAIVLKIVFVSDPDSSTNNPRHTATVNFLLPMSREEFEGYGELLTQDLTIYRTAQQFAYNIAEEIFPELFVGKEKVPSYTFIDGTSQDIDEGLVKLAELKFLKANDSMYMTKSEIEDYFKEEETDQIRLLGRVAYRGKEDFYWWTNPSYISNAVVVATQQEVEEFMESIDPDDFYDLKYGANRTVRVQNLKR